MSTPNGIIDLRDTWAGRAEVGGKELNRFRFRIQIGDAAETHRVTEADSKDVR